MLLWYTQKDPRYAFIAYQQSTHLAQHPILSLSMHNNRYRVRSLGNLNSVYVINLHLEGKVCVIVGGGKVAERKATALLQGGARLTVVSPTLSEGFSGLAVNHIAQDYRTEHLHQTRPHLVIAATNQPSVNRQVAQDAHQVGAWVNVADGSAESDFDNLPMLARPPLSVAVSTGGASPILARHLLHAIDQQFGALYQALATHLLELRPQVQARYAHASERQAFWERVLQPNALVQLHTLPVETATAHLKGWVAQHLQEEQP